MRAHFFISGKVTVKIKEKNVIIICKTSFPYDGKITLTIEGNKDIEFELAVRIPGYVNDYSISLDGDEFDKKYYDKGHAYLKINVHKQIEIQFSILPKFIHANPMVREDSGKVAIEKGPLVYCIEEIDNGSNLPAYFVDTKQLINEEYRDDILNGTTILKFKGKKISQDNWETDELYKETDIIWEEKELTAVPYCYWGNRTHGEMLVWMKELFT